MKNKRFFWLALVGILGVLGLTSCGKSLVGKASKQLTVFAEEKKLFDEKLIVVKHKTRDTIINHQGKFLKVKLYRMADSVYVLKLQLDKSSVEKSLNELIEKIIQRLQKDGTTSLNKQSMKAELFKALVERIEEIPEIKRIDWNRDQLQKPGKNNVFLLPEVLVKIGEIQWQTKGGQGVQEGETVVTISIIQENYQEFHGPAPVVEQALAKLGFPDLLYFKLQGFSGERFTGLDRISTGEEDFLENIIVHTIGFKTKLTDDSILRELQKSRILVSPNLQINKQIL